MGTLRIFKASLSMIALAISAGASGSVIYQMIGGECNDSNRELIPYEVPAPLPDMPPFMTVYGPGPKLCNDQVFAELRLTDAYVPGTWFQEDRDHPDVRYAESLYFTDGHYSVFWNFEEVNYFGSVSGYLPSTGTHPSDFWYRWNSMMGNSFLTGGGLTRGGWEFHIEGGAGSAPCGIGSVEGPDGPCVGPWLDHYVSMGTYTGWRLIAAPASEPPSFALVALGAIALGIFGRRALARKR